MGPAERMEKRREEKERQLAYVKDLRSRVCWCGKPKQSKNSLCRKCFWGLPVDLRRALYQEIGQGCEAAYDAAVAFLKKKKGGA